MSGYGFHYGPCSPRAVSAAPVVVIALGVAAYAAGGDDPKPSGAKQAAKATRDVVEPAATVPAEPSALAAAAPWLLAALAVAVVGWVVWQMVASSRRATRTIADPPRYRSAAELRATPARPVGSPAGVLSDSQRRELVAELVAPVEMPEKVP